jgi:hypothetical protein
MTNYKLNWTEEEILEGVYWEKQSYLERLSKHFNELNLSTYKGYSKEWLSNDLIRIYDTYLDNRSEYYLDKEIELWLVFLRLNLEGRITVDKIICE